MASNITFVVLLAFVLACAMPMSIPKAGAQLFLPCKTTKDCEYYYCSSGRPLCVSTQCQCTISSTHEARLDDIKTKKNNAKACKLTTDCDPRMKFTCASRSYMCFDGLCTCTN
ncbi:defensin-like protein 295 [Raphanus sativus]|uniref:Defensin-like protein 295 n=1 Tax=Raphanus sativus TaxID=3726 RepID=A0A6J0JSX7_RAPSA|nr:defensin-like protein 295 [Raphanus sativus]